MDQDWTSKTVRVLTPIVRMVPIGARLVDLFLTSALNLPNAAL